MSKTMLEWMGWPAREGLRRDLLGWLIQAKGPSVVSTLAGFEIGQRDPSSEIVRKEVQLPKVSSQKKLSRIDLLVETTTHLVGIEVKVCSKQHSGQLKRYSESLAEMAAKKTKKPFLLFVTETREISRVPPRVQTKGRDGLSGGHLGRDGHTYSKGSRFRSYRAALGNGSDSSMG